MSALNFLTERRDTFLMGRFNGQHIAQRPDPFRSQLCFVSVHVQLLAMRSSQVAADKLSLAWIYVDTNHQVGHPDHLKVFANPQALGRRFPGRSSRR
jgi:hypothetical protein